MNGMAIDVWCLGSRGYSLYLVYKLQYLSQIILRSNVLVVVACVFKEIWYTFVDCVLVSCFLTINWASSVAVKWFCLEIFTNYFSGPSTPAWFIRSAILFSKSSIRLPISSMRVIIWSDIVWNLSWTFCNRLWT